ncbi:GGDEF domain-containing protein [Chromatocurvus halotolerans]|uniref:Diguanylate cyclase (GGDEF)-like protein n=1 Tax=Chromatocurvus halotolerans TaxID=1132028 RepID=A0A4V2SBI0_9GAMM|nr:GGDEF domain-containing protein [Chromatocurvus halotolerans]TCO75550.1 diguanylate cyclase (GGDEF)-like protein [Chromatocurvus halotolerans]
MSLRNTRCDSSCGALVRDDAGKPSHVVVVSRDITDRVADEQRILEMAYHDPLTELPNRRLLEDRIDQAMLASQRSGNYGALLLLDLDQFKELNDECGHALGDALLIEAAARILGSVRKSDTVARLGGDEFVVLLGALDTDKQTSRAKAQQLAEKLRVKLARLYRLRANDSNGDEPAGHIEHRCTGSIGVALFLGREISIDELLERADKAMYNAKHAGANRISFADGPLEK